MPTRNWEASLSDRTRKAYIKEGAKKGWSESRTKAYYENPSNNLGILRRHVTKSGGAVPEHGLKDVQRNPKKYAEYLKRNQPFKGGSKAAPNRDTLKSDFIRSVDNKLSHYFKYDANTVRANADLATDRELMLGIRADEDQLLDLARIQRAGNPFWYHSN